MKVYDKLYIDGAWTAPSGKGQIDVINPSTEDVIAKIPEGNADDVKRAVAAAKAAFETWSQTSVEVRADLLQKLAAGLGARMKEIGETIASEVGMPVKMAVGIQAGLPAASCGSFVQILKGYRFEETVGSSTVLREPVGVVGCITPWNYPLHQIIGKIAPALAAGCTVVLKPSEVAPINAFLLAEIIDSIGLPKGVFNLVTGFGPVVGEALAAHPDVDMVSFTGSTRAGKRVAELGSQRVARVTLELGGKSANVILDDADLETAVTRGVGDCYLNSGQTCSALTRMLVPRAKHDQAVAIAKRVAESFTVGPAFSDDAKLGPLVSDVQRERVRGYIKKGIAEGATLVTGGADKPAGLDKGYFVKPTVFSNVRNDMTIAQEEIFGPVLSIIPYDTEEDAIRIANQSIYGLGGGVWSGDVEHAKRVAKRIRTGQVAINGGGFNLLAPFGGYKQSGRGREFGQWGFEEYLEVKSLQI